MLVRDPARLEGDDPQHTVVVTGNVLDQGPVDDCVDAVVCVLGTSGRGEAVEERGTRTILNAMAKHGVRRLVVVTSLGVGDSRGQVPFLFRMVMDLMLKRIMVAKEAQEQLVRESDTDRTIVRPGGLQDGPLTENYRYGVEPSIKAGRINRANIAHFVLEQLTDNRFVCQAPAVTGRS